MTTTMNKQFALAIAAATLTTATLLVGGDASAGPVRGLPNQPAPPSHSGISGVGVRPIVGAGGISGVGVRPVVGAGGISGVGVRPVVGAGGISGVGVRPVVGALPTGGSNPPGIIVDPCLACINHGHDHDHDRDYDHDHDHRHWGHHWDFGLPAVIETEARPDYCVYEYKWRARYVPGFGLERVLVKVCDDI
jgi:hypothetical protein